jgi:hypothetical protein
MQRSFDVRRQAAKVENIWLEIVSDNRLKTERRISRKKLQQGTRRRTGHLLPA